MFPSLYLGLLYCTLDIKLNVPCNSCFFFLSSRNTMMILLYFYYFNFGGLWRADWFWKNCCCALQSEGKGSVSFLKDLLFSSWYHKRQGDLTLVTFWHLVPGYCSRNECGTASQVACLKIGEIMYGNCGLASGRNFVT